MAVAKRCEMRRVDDGCKVIYGNRFESFVCCAGKQKRRLNKRVV